MRVHARSIVALLIALAMTVSIVSGCGMIRLPYVGGGSKAVSAEENLAGILKGGFLYTPKISVSSTEERRYLTLREEAVALFKDALGNLAAGTFAAADDLKMHEDLLYQYMDEIEPGSGDLIKRITEGMLSYRTAFMVNKEQINRFSLIKPDDRLMRAYTGSLVFEAVCRQADTLIDYLSWLMGSTEVVIGLLEPGSPDKARELSAACENLYRDEIIGRFTGMLKEYLTAARIYTYILSADYYIGESNLGEIVRRLDDMKPGTAVDGIRRLCEALLQTDRKPSVTIEPIMTKSLSFSPGQAGHPIKLAAAAAIAENETGQQQVSAAVSLLGQVADNTSADLDVTVSAGAVMAETILDSDGTNDIRDGSKTRLDLSSGAELRNRISDSAGGGNPDSQAVQSKTELSIMQNDAKAALLREETIALITKAQQGLAAADMAATITMLSADTKYTLVIKAIKALLPKIRTLDPKKIQTIGDMLENDLSRVLGEKKEVFIQRLITTNAEELLDTFDVWKENTKTFKELKISRDDIVRLVTIVGVDVTAEEQAAAPASETPAGPEETPSASPSASESAGAASASPQAKVEQWEGEVNYTESYLRYTDGTSKNGKPENGSGIFKFTISRNAGELTCTVGKVAEFDINGLAVTELIYENNDIIIMLEGEQAAGIKTALYWDGIVSDDGKYMEGTCKVVISISSDTAQPQEEQSNDLDLPVPNYVELNGIFYANLKQ